MIAFLQLMLVIVAVSNGFAGETSAQVESAQQLFNGCASKARIDTKSLTALEDKPSDWPIPEDMQNFICCAAKSLVENRKVNVQHIQSMVNKRSAGSNVNVASVVEKCGSIGIDPNNLATCYQTSTLLRCIFGHLRESTSTNESDLTRFFKQR